MALALYRKYRPGSFAEVKGQEHVTAPLCRALANDRIHHAYLFSGPRGCGKTSSARILARSLNCEQGPTADPCGRCDSCVALAPNGAGSLDVIEIDAASHNGVDDARDLRDKAFFAPVRDRFKVYIIDEAHMITGNAFNALLKLVEEPPEFVKFVFATTEPDKIIQTIRSRTHHYPFRLMSRTALTELLEGVIASEGIPVDTTTVLPLVVRAAQGSARDGLSILDQVLASAGPEGVTREMAAGLLGVTPDVLLDDVLDAFGAADAAAVFATVDRVMESGHDPRRFAADVLERLRDLVILDAVPDAGEKGILDCTSEQLDRMRRQAAALGRAGLSRAADLLHEGLNEMRGTTAPRLLLELVCARVLLPAASDDAVVARVERLERRLDIGGTPAASPTAPVRVAAAPARPAAPVAPAPPVKAAPTVRDEASYGYVGPGQAPESLPPEARRPAPSSAHGVAAVPAGGQRGGAASGSALGPSAPGAPAGRAPAAQVSSGASRPVAAPAVPAAPSVAPDPARPAPGVDDGWPEAATPGAPAAGTPVATAAAAPPPPGPEPVGEPAPPRPLGGGLDAAAVRRVWDQVLEHVKQRKRVTHARLLDAQVVEVADGVIAMGFTTATLARQFQEGVNIDYLREALQAVVGADLKVTCSSGPGGVAAAPPTPAAGPSAPPPQPAHDGFAPGDEPADEEEGAPAPPVARGDDAALRLVEEAFEATVLSTERPGG